MSTAPAVPAASTAPTAVTHATMAAAAEEAMYEPFGGMQPFTFVYNAPARAFNQWVCEEMAGWVEYAAVEEVDEGGESDSLLPELVLSNSESDDDLYTEEPAKLEAAIDVDDLNGVIKGVGAR